MDDDVDVVDVQAAGGDVGGDQHLELALAELLERVLALALAQVAVDRGGVHALLVEGRGPAGRRTRLVLVKASVWPLWRAMAAATFTLSISWTMMKRWIIASTVTVAEATSWYTGSCW